MDDKQFVKIIKQYPALYDLCDTNYHNQLRRDIIWEEIADKLDVTAEECRKRWQSLKSAYKRSIKKRNTKPKPLKPWRLETQMEFLNSYLVDREHIKSDDGNSDVDKAEPAKNRYQNIDEEKLIELVQQRPMLYNTNDKNYNNHHVRDKSWEDIGKIMGVEDEACRQKWRNLRDCFRKSIRHRCKSLALGKTIKRWRLEGHMEFIREFLVNENLLRPLNYSDDIDSDSRSNDPLALNLADSADEVEQPVYKNIKADHLTKYFQAAEETVRTFPPELQIQAKRKISEIILEFELLSLKSKTGDNIM